MEPDRTSENDTEHDAPVRFVTVSQIVARNIAWFRRAAGMTQEQLGGLLGWLPSKVSEAERSRNGKRTRQFDAYELVALSLAFGVPLNAFFLPPPDDGHDVRYTFQPPGAEEPLGMDVLLEAVTSDSESEAGVMQAYRVRYLNAVGRYLAEGWQEEVAAWLRPLVGPEILEEGAYRLEAKRVQDLAAAEWEGRMAEALTKAARQAREESA
jgi:transcriptional regulator with XRE-family HTH domain